MGLLFNTAETMKMVARINKHFAARSEGGQINKWRKPGKKKLFKKGGPDRRSLNQIARDERVSVDPADDDDNETRNTKWLDWLDALSSAPSTTLSQFYPNSVAASATPSDVGTELSHQIWQGLSDEPNCKEIVVSVVPSDTIRVDEWQKIPPNPTGAYTLLLTVHTVEATLMKATIKKIVQARRSAGARKQS
ncbi:MAG: hypothetical protein EPO41_27740 [Reyranella sp.]|uniref:hypothetical protein n=1 Tax=Reyranella sp. TaxID=1929291 RepID=UPI00120A7F07|nr:hypothetical protein [Reyranella sp.]TAJ85154.1 MAG: hypothetical protein EPO41_27740 [Reyranella sp.]